MFVRGFLALSTVLGMVTVSWADAVQMARFKAEYPPAASRLEEQFAKVKGSCQLWHKSPGKGSSKPKRPAEATFAFDHGCEKVEIRQDASAKSTSEAPDALYYSSAYVVCIQDRTFLHLEKAPGSSEYKIQENTLDIGQLAAYMDMFGRFPRARTHLIGSPISELMKRPDFQLLGADEIVQDGRTLLKVELERGTAERKLRASLVFDPSAGWVIRSGEYSTSADGANPTTFEIAYDSTNESAPLPRTVVFHSPSGDEYCEFLHWRFDSTAPEEFQPSHWNMPEIGSVAKQPKKNNLTYWLAGLAATGFVAALALRRLASRR